MSQLQESTQKEKVQLVEAQDESEKKHQEIQRLHQTINTVKTNSQRQIDELQVREGEVAARFYRRVSDFA